MPYSAPSRCSDPGCTAIAINRGRCDEHQRKAWTGDREPTHIRYGQSGSKRAAQHKRVLGRDGYICYRCGLPGADTVDHMLAIADGGSKTDEANLGAIHQDPCHLDKTHEENARRRARRAARRAAEAARLDGLDPVL